MPGAELGDKLRELRLAKGLTLSELAKMTELSAAYLSNVERDATSPTINNLFNICRALRVDITAILSDTASPKVVVRKSERQEVFHTNSKVKYELISEGTENLKGVCITIPEDCYDEIVSDGHERNELGIITEGSISMTLDNKEYILEPGDSIYIINGTHHKYHKVGGGQCVSYWAFVNPDASDVKDSYGF